MEVLPIGRTLQSLIASAPSAGQWRRRIGEEYILHIGLLELAENTVTRTDGPSVSLSARTGWLSELKSGKERSNNTTGKVTGQEHPAGTEQRGQVVKYARPPVALRRETAINESPHVVCF